MDRLISVIVPVYNVEDYLEKCVDSIINQTYKNLEIILIDDGSTDSCPSFCDELKKRDKRIKVVHKSNGGLSSARNKGLDIAKGSLISFVDSDDYMEESMLEELKNNMDKYSSDIAVCDFYTVIGSKKQTHSYKEKEFVLEEKQKFDYLDNEYGNLTVYAWNKLYKKSLFDEIRYPDGKIFEDSHIICELLEKARRVSYVVKPLYNYIMRKDSIIHTFTIHHFDKVDSFNKKIEFFKNKEYYDLMVEEKNRKVRFLVTSLAKLKHFNRHEKEVGKKYHNELVNTSKSIQWKKASKVTKNFKVLRKVYIYFKFLEYKMYYLFER